jgi:hypothetical protein
MLAVSKDFGDWMHRHHTVPRVAFLIVLLATICCASLGTSLSHMPAQAHSSADAALTATPAPPVPTSFPADVDSPTVTDSPTDVAGTPSVAVGSPSAQADVTPTASPDVTPIVPAGTPVAQTQAHAQRLD